MSRSGRSGHAYGNFGRGYNDHRNHGRDHHDRDHHGNGHGNGGGWNPTNPTPTEPTETSAKWVLSSGGVTVEVTATIVGGNVVFNYALTSGKADLNGFFIDVNNDGGAITSVGSKANSMTGLDSDGDKLNGFDYAKSLGSLAGNDANHTSGTLTVSLSSLKITSLDQLADSEIGIRATSGSGCHGNPLKLAGTGEIINPPEPDLCDRPLDGHSVAGYVEMQDEQITNLTLTFYDADSAQHVGDTSGDWYYTVSIDVPAEMGEDPDAYLDQIVAMLVEQDPFVDSSDYVKSVIVTDCDGDRANYNLQDYAQNNPLDPEAADDLPWIVFNEESHILTALTDVAGHTEANYALEMNGDAFVFV